MEKHDLNIYIVGGAVRDFLLEREVKDKDFVVVGSSEEEMMDLGFQKVGADFPVFICPVNKHEYALARTEKKTGSGYLGFEVNADKSVTLTDDLFRRDLTINAMALRELSVLNEPESFVEEEHLIDPFGGYEDLQNKILRHTSDAFIEDPVRVLRIARFRARMGSDWIVAEETKNLIYSMARRGILNELNGERIWKELSRALMEDHPRLFFDTLLECDALNAIFPDIYKLASTLESKRWHPEGTAYEHTMLVLTQAAKHGYDLEARVAALLHDIGKGLTPRELYPAHFGHDVKGVPIVKYFCDQYKIPTKIKNRVALVTRYHMNMHRLEELNAKTFVKMFDSMKASNDPEVVALLFRLGVCDERGRLGSEENDISGLYFLFSAYVEYKGVKFSDLFPNGEDNVNKIKNEFFKARVNKIKMRVRE